MSGSEVQIFGLDDVMRGLESGSKEATRIMRNTVNNVAQEASKDARGKAPKSNTDHTFSTKGGKNWRLIRKGTLRRGIKAKSYRMRRGQKVFRAGLQVTHGKKVRRDRDAFYWHFVEHGTKNMRAAPSFIESTRAEYETKAVNIFKTKAANNIRKAIWKRIN